jgi:5'-3' exonuclease
MEHLSSDDKKKLFSMFKNMDISKTPVERKLNTEVLLVDGLNCFFRSFMAVPSMNDNGLHVGGIAGFLQSVGYAAKLLNPTRIVIVFDGVGGSLKRRKIYPDYKEKRKTNLKYNRSYEELTSDEKENRNIQSQLLRLIGYLASVGFGKSFSPAISISI